MAELDSGLETIESYGTQGWSAIVDADIELLDEKLEHVLTAGATPGTLTVAANAASVTNPAAQTSEVLSNLSTGTITNTINDVGASFSQSGLNDNFASLLDEVNKLRADMVESRARETEYKTAIESLKATVNALLIALRKTTGTGILSD